MTLLAQPRPRPAVRGVETVILGDEEDEFAESSVKMVKAGA